MPKGVRRASAWKSISGRLGLAACVLSAGLSCGQEADQDVQVQSFSLPAKQWEVVSSSPEDPFAQHRIGRLPCTSSATRMEATWLEVSTEACNYMTLVQRLAKSLSSAQQLVGQVA